MNPVFKQRLSPAMPLWEGKVSPPNVGQTLYYQELPPQFPSMVTLAGPVFEGSPANHGPPVMCGPVLQPVNPSVMSSPVFISPVTRPLVISSTKELRNSAHPQTQGLTDMFFKLAAWKNGIKIGLEDKQDKSRMKGRRNSFEEMARRKGIRVGDQDPYPVVPVEENKSDDDDVFKGDSLEESTCSEDHNVDEVKENFKERARQSGIRIRHPDEEEIEEEYSYYEEAELDAFKYEVDEELKHSFEEKARQSGIRIGRPEGDTKVRCESVSSVEEENGLEVSTSESIITVPEPVESFEDLAKRICTNVKRRVVVVESGNKFEKIAEQKGIKIGKPAAGDADFSEMFEEIAKRNGIKVSKPGSNDIYSAFGARMDGLRTSSPNFDDIENTVLGSSVRGLSFSEIPSWIPGRGISCHASSQTHSCETVDYYSQTALLSTLECAIQVDAKQEAFEKEFSQWKLDAMVAQDPSEGYYRELYIESKRDQDELSKRLENELDINVKSQRNHKQIVDKLKQELDTRDEQIEKQTRDLKTLKKHKDMEIKRLTKDNKQKDEDLASLANSVKSKERDLEKLQCILNSNNEEVEALKVQVAALEALNGEMNKERECSQCALVNEKTKVTVEHQSKPGNKTSPDGWTLVTGHKIKDKMVEPVSLSKERNAWKMDELSDFRCDVFHKLPQGSDYKNEEKRETFNDRFSASIHGYSPSFTQTSAVSSRVSNTRSDDTTVASASTFCKSLAPGIQLTSIDKAEGVPALMSLEEGLTCIQPPNTNYDFGNNRYAPLATSSVSHLAETQASSVNGDEKVPANLPSTVGFMQPSSSAYGSHNTMGAPLSTPSGPYIVASHATSVNRDEDVHTQLPLTLGLMQPVKPTLTDLGQEVTTATMMPMVTSSCSNTTADSASKTALDTSGSVHTLASQTPWHDGMAANYPVPSSAYALQNPFKQPVVDTSFPPGLPQLNGFPGLVSIPLLTHPLPPQAIGEEERIVDEVQSSQSSQDVKRVTSLQKLLSFEPSLGPVHHHSDGKDMQKRFTSGINSSNLPENHKTKTQCARPPPGIRVDPIPVVESTPKAVKESKYSSFDKLMDALKKKFPTTSKGELMLYLRKAKEICGPEGFRKKQISEVVEKVAGVIREEEVKYHIRFTYTSAVYI